MFTRIVLFFLSLSILGWFSRAIVQPVATIASTNMSLATINGGNTEYVANQSYIQTFNYGWFSIGFIVLAFVFFYAPIKKALDKSNSSKHVFRQLGAEEQSETFKYVGKRIESYS